MKRRQKSHINVQQLVKGRGQREPSGSSEMLFNNSGGFDQNRLGGISNFTARGAFNGYFLLEEAQSAL